jgi:O-acetyl-ADP-ribose deacetylase
MATFNKTRVVVKLGDITEENCDAIVNAANSSLMGGGGVDGAIHRIGGPTVHDECLAIAREQGGCPTGQAVTTGAGNLPARLLIHAVGPVWHGGSQSEDDLLRSAYLSSLRLAAEAKAQTIAFPSLSTGAYRFPIERAAAISLRAIYDYARENTDFTEIRFILFSESDLIVYERALEELVAASL